MLIAREQARPLDHSLPDDVAVSVISIAELELGVLMASDADFSDFADAVPVVRI